MNRYLLFSLLLLASAIVRADFDPYYSDRHRGWFYHEAPPAPAPKRAPEPVKPEPPRPAEPAKPAEPAPLSVAWIKQNLEKAKVRAIDDPSRENLKTSPQGGFLHSVRRNPALRLYTLQSAHCSAPLPVHFTSGASL